MTNEERIQARTQQIIAEQIGLAVLSAASLQARLEVMQHSANTKPHPEAGDNK